MLVDEVTSYNDLYKIVNVEKYKGWRFPTLSEVKFSISNLKSTDDFPIFTGECKKDNEGTLGLVDSQAAKIMYGAYNTKDGYDVYFDADYVIVWLIKEDGSSPTSCPSGDPFDEISISTEEKETFIDGPTPKEERALLIKHLGNDNPDISDDATLEILSKLAQFTDDEIMEILNVLTKADKK